jgi:hypothetical protein
MNFVLKGHPLHPRGVNHGQRPPKGCKDPVTVVRPWNDAEIKVCHVIQRRYIATNELRKMLTLTAVSIKRLTADIVVDARTKDEATAIHGKCKRFMKVVDIPRVLERLQNVKWLSPAVLRAAMRPFKDFVDYEVDVKPFERELAPPAPLGTGTGATIMSALQGPRPGRVHLNLVSDDSEEQEQGQDETMQPHPGTQGSSEQALPPQEPLRGQQEPLRGQQEPLRGQQEPLRGQQEPLKGRGPDDEDAGPVKKRARQDMETRDAIFKRHACEQFGKFIENAQAALSKEYEAREKTIVTDAVAWIATETAKLEARMAAHVKDTEAKQNQKIKAIEASVLAAIRATPSDSEKNQ